MPYLSKLSLQDERILATARGLENAMVPVWFVLWFYAPLHGSTSTFQVHPDTGSISYLTISPIIRCIKQYIFLGMNVAEGSISSVAAQKNLHGCLPLKWSRRLCIWKVRSGLGVAFGKWRFLFSFLTPIGFWALGSGTDMSFTFVDCLPAGCIWDVVQGEQEASKPTASRSLPSFGSSNYSSRQLRNAWLCCRYASRKYTYIFFAQWWPSFVFLPPLNIALSSSLPVDWTPSAAIGALVRLKVNGSLYRGHRYVGVWASWNSWNWKERAIVWLSARLKVLSGRPEHRGEARECDDIFSQSSRSHKHLVTNSCSHWPWIKSDKWSWTWQEMKCWDVISLVRSGYKIVLSKQEGAAINRIMDFPCS